MTSHTDHFQTLALADALQVTAPDGSAVHVLLRRPGGSMARFALAPGQVSQAVVHRTVEEIWFVVEGAGEMWRRQGEGEAATEAVTPLSPGVCLTIPLGTRFQFRAAPDAPLVAVAVTMPPWPGADEAVAVDGPWRPGPPA